MEKLTLPVYEAPQVITYTDEQILEELGQPKLYWITSNSLVI